jgi:hypothetical protein
MRQDVEHSLSRAITGWPRIATLRGGNRPAFEPSSDNTHDDRS